MSGTNRDEIPIEDLVPSLQKRYRSSKEYRIQKRTKSISSIHPLVYATEKRGLEKMINQFIGDLSRNGDVLMEYKNRNRDKWIDEWCNMHDALFKYVLKNRGYFRKKGHDVYFGDIGDEEYFNIPHGGNETLIEIYNLASNIGILLSSVKKDDINDICRFLATVHFDFVRIHPFGDGNGRIARAITDQLAISLGYPPVIAGFPRTDEIQKKRYHEAIRGCVGDNSRKMLATWIKNKIEKSISEIA